MDEVREIVTATEGSDLFDVGARAERPPCPVYDHRAHRPLRFQGAQGFGEIGVGLGADDVESVGAIEFDPGHRVHDAGGDPGGHGSLSRDRAQVGEVGCTLLAVRGEAFPDLRTAEADELQPEGRLE